jgi:hypothetical protein
MMRDDDCTVVLRLVANELMAGDVTIYHRDNMLCAETVFIVQEAHVQLVEHFSNVISSHNQSLSSAASTSVVVPVRATTISYRSIITVTSADAVQKCVV